MGLDINNIKQASPKANQVATEQYVDTSIADIDVSSDISANNDTFAQKLGYLNYASMVAAASNGQSIIIGGYLRTSLIQANAITANQINTTGLIAEDISATNISGKTITGAVINGARINGSVIKTSYLDLNGSLQVLTNYIITQAMYNANPSLYTDSVYISADGNYRIPSLSVIYEQNIASSIANNGGILYGNIRSYNTANAGHNNKCVKLNPVFNIVSDTIIIDMSQQGTANCNGSLYFGDTLLARIVIVSFSSNVLNYTVYTADNTYNRVINDSDPNSTYVYSDLFSFSSAGINFTVSVGGANNQYGYSVGVKLTIKQGQYTFNQDFTNTLYGFKIIRNYSENNGYTTFNTKLGPNISINNLM